MYITYMYVCILNLQHIQLGIPSKYIAVGDMYVCICTVVYMCEYCVYTTCYTLL
jgi:hypothetical protein